MTTLVRPRFLPGLLFFFATGVSPLVVAQDGGDPPDTTVAEDGWIGEARKAVEQCVGRDFIHPVEVLFIDPFGGPEGFFVDDAEFMDEFDLEGFDPDAFPEELEFAPEEFMGDELMGPDEDSIEQQRVLAALGLIPLSFLQFLEEPMMEFLPGDFEEGGEWPDEFGGGFEEMEGFDEFGGFDEFAMPEFEIPVQVFFDGQGIIVFGGTEADEERPTDEIRQAVIRELAFALRQQHHPEYLDPTGDGNQDEMMARQAVALGVGRDVASRVDGPDGDLKSFDGLFQPNGFDLGPGWQERAMDEGMIPPPEFADPSEAESTESMVRLATFPAAHGLEFHRAVRAMEGSPDPFGYPPLSTEQILHPEKFAGEKVDLPVDVDLGLYARLLEDAGMEIAARTTLGEWTTRCVLAQSAPDVAEDAAAGWDGDELLLVGDDRSALVWLSVWDSEEDAQAFEQAVRAWTAKQFDGKVARTKRDGDRVLVIGGLSEEKTTAVLELGVQAAKIQPRTRDL